MQLEAVTVIGKVIITITNKKTAAGFSPDSDGRFLTAGTIMYDFEFI